MSDKIQKIILNEISNPSFDNTRKFLNQYNVVKENGIPKIERIDTNRLDESIDVYLPIEKKNFYLVVQLDSRTHIHNVEICPGNRIYLSITSENLSYDELTALTNLKSTSGWNKSEIVPPIKIPRKYSCLVIEPYIEKAYKFENKLIRLLKYLESDYKKISNLSKHAEAEIIVVWYGYKGNGCLGGFVLSQQILHILNKLNLSIDFDLYVDL